MRRERWAKGVNPCGDLYRNSLFGSSASEHGGADDLIARLPLGQRVFPLPVQPVGIRERPLALLRLVAKAVEPLSFGARYATRG